MPGGEKILLKRALFRPVADSLYQGLSTDKNKADSVFVPAFDRIFLLLKAFYLNGLSGDILEFGVLQGYTSQLIADCMKRFRLKRARLHLFDSFEGLPEATQQDQYNYECIKGFWSKGVMNVPEGIDRLIEATLRKKLGTDHVFAVKGYFEKTLETHIRDKKITKALLINLDCDYYSSSKYVLRTLFEYDLIQDGTILICDDWMTSFGNPLLGQRRAVAEIRAEYPRWEFEPYLNYGIGSQVFVVHDLSIAHGKTHENTSCCSL